MFHSRTVLGAAVALGISLTSCSDEQKVRTYQLAGDDAAVAASVPGIAAVSRPLRWQAPPEWTQEEPGQFQTALYRIGRGSTVSVSRLPGDAGGITSNVNRWRQQIGLDPVAETGGEIIALEEAGSQARWFELRGERESILAAIIPLANETWFFKFNTPTGELESGRAGFVTFLQSIQIGTNGERPDDSASTASAKPRIDLKVPEDWQKQEGDPIRAASFRIPAPAGIDGDVSVIPLTGEIGTTLEYVNLWRAQLRLPALASESDDALTRMHEGTSGPFIVVHMVSAEPLFSGDRHGAISAAILKAGEVTWFFKMAADAGLVGRNRDKFTELVRSAVIP